MKRLDADIAKKIEEYCRRYQYSGRKAHKPYQYRTYKQIAERFDISYFQIQNIIAEDEDLCTIFVNPLTNGEEKIHKRGDLLVEYKKDTGYLQKDSHGTTDSADLRENECSEIVDI